MVAPPLFNKLFRFPKQKIRAVNNPLLEAFLMPTEFPNSHFVTFKSVIFICAILHAVLQHY